MEFEETQAWCNDLSLELSDVTFFAIAELTKAPKMGYFDRKPWIEGWRTVRKDTVEAQKQHLASLRQQLSSDADYYKQVYNFAFPYAKEESQKSLCEFMSIPLMRAAGSCTLLSSHSARAGECDMARPHGGSAAQHVHSGLGVSSEQQ